MKQKQDFLLLWKIFEIECRALATTVVKWDTAVDDVSTDKGIPSKSLLLWIPMFFTTSDIFSSAVGVINPSVSKTLCKEKRCSKFVPSIFWGSCCFWGGFLANMVYPIHPSWHAFVTGQLGLPPLWTYAGYYRSQIVQPYMIVVVLITNIFI